MTAQVERAAEWVYRGIWRVLSSWFCVPQHPPTLPSHGGEVRSFHPSIQFLKYLKLYFWIVLIVIDLLLIAAWGAVFWLNPLVGLLLSPVFLFVIVVPDVLAYIAIHLRYDTTWYVMSDRSLRCRRGVWVIGEHTVTFENVQDVKVHRGPIQQLFGIAKIVVETAGADEGEGENQFHIGNKAVLEGIDNPDELRGLIMDRVRTSRSAGLGDERLPQKAPVRWGADEVALLHEIRDAARGLA
ncbi:MAG: PH domain-containing protein [Planctomycetota bacterium]